jgi:rubrerythrin
MDGAKRLDADPTVRGATPESDEEPVPTVLIAEGNETRHELYTTWIADGPAVRTADRADEAIDELDDDIAVAVVGHDVQGDRQNLRNRIYAIAPYCRVALCVYPCVDPSIDADEVIEIPTSRSEFRSVIGRLVRRREYDRTIEQYYLARLREAVLEGNHTETELAVHEEYDSITDRVNALQERLAEITAGLTDEDFRSIFAEIEQRGPSDILSLLEGRSGAQFGPVTVGSSKYRPDSCPECGNDWNDLQRGKEPFVRIGAFVWTCTDCGTIQEMPDPSHQRVAFR